MYNLFSLLFQICILYKVYGLEIRSDANLEALCKSGKKPVSSERTICAYWIGDVNGTNEARLVHNKGINISLHGVFPEMLKPKIPNIPYQQFVAELERDLNLTHFIDVASSTNYTCCCSQYHEYTKHGSKSGYTYSEWLNEIEVCLGFIFSLDKDKFESTCSPDFCHFNGSVNLVQECFIGDEGAYNGCKKGHPFIYSDL